METYRYLTIAANAVYDRLDTEIKLLESHIGSKDSIIGAHKDYWETQRAEKIQLKEDLKKIFNKMLRESMGDE